MASTRYFHKEIGVRGCKTEIVLRTADTPKVSIGMPVYNGASTIGRAISAILRQTFEDFELIISDNGSTDNTLELCEVAAKSDPRVRIIRQGQNRGAIANFEAVLMAARGGVFVFAAADDRVEPHFLDEALAALDATPEAVACAPRTLIHFDGGRCREARGTSPVGGPAWWRPARFLLRPSDNSRFYGLYRTTALRAGYPGNHHFHAFDWAVTALTLSQGTHIQSRSIILHRRGAERGKYLREHFRDASGLLDRLFPLARMSGALLSRLKPSQLPLAIPVLLLLNMQKCAEHLLALTRGVRRG